MALKPSAVFGQVGLLLTLFVAGCVSGPDSLPPQPSAPVQSNDLPPLDVTPGEPAGSDLVEQDNPLEQDQLVTDNADATVAPSSFDTPASADKISLSRTDLLGAWTLSSGGDTCQLFMTLTTWSGGFRATTRQCQTDVLRSVSAWKLDGKILSLIGNDGGIVGQLYPETKTRFTGRISSTKQPVSFYR